MSNIFTTPHPFLNKKRKHHIAIIVVTAKTFKSLAKTQSKFAQKQIENAGFTGEAQTNLCVLGESGEIEFVLAGVSEPQKYFDTCHSFDYIKKSFTAQTLKTTSFEIDVSHIKNADMNKIFIGWGWAAYSFDAYKENAEEEIPALVWHKEADKTRVLSQIDAVNQLRNLINTPANDCGPDELEEFARFIADKHGGKVKVIKDKQLLDKNFPLIYTVGKASPRTPRLIEFTWGKASDPKITLVGKGVVFDTGGLNLKPGQYMRHMKKDMGGAAHALNLAYLIMENKLPVNLRVLVPAVENAVAGEAFRPGDIIKSRKGTFVENTNTDAEGRLILADSLTYACEDEPELIIDFATLTGSARAALGPDIPAFFATDDKLAQALQKLSFDIEDPVWNMPLHAPYKKHIKSSAGDLVNSASLPGDLIYSALFLQHFLQEGKKSKKTPHWVHFDCYAWEQTGRPGRPSGAADTGLRAMYAYLEKTYG
ncbi:MAG: leucyl aminopeptidase family protein [Alphaproteobacteria bacterium]